MQLGEDPSGRSRARIAKILHVAQYRVSRREAAGDRGDSNNATQMVLRVNRFPGGTSRASAHTGGENHLPRAVSLCMSSRQAALHWPDGVTGKVALLLRHVSVVRGWSSRIGRHHRLCSKLLHRDRYLEPLKNASALSACLEVYGCS